MKILINCINLLSGSQGSGGAGKYVYALVSGLAKISTVRVLVQPHNFVRFQKINGIQVVPLIDNSSSAIQDNLCWSDVYLCPLNELVPNYIDSKVPVVSCILDLQHETYPHFFKDGIYEARRNYYGYAISRADAVITISNHEKSLIQKIYNKQEVYVTYLAGYLDVELISDIFQSNRKNKFNIPETSYIIYPAIPWRHKNHYRLVESIWLLKREYPILKNIKLILTGALEHNLKSSDFLERIITSLNMHDSVEVRGFISDLELAMLIKKAKLMVFPSLYEGFGIPLVDSMNLGTPVLTTSLASIPEVCQDAVAYLKNPFNSKQIARDIAELLMNEELLSDLSNLSIKQRAKYSLQGTADETLKVLTEVVNKHRSGQSINFISAKAANHYASRTTQRLTILIDFISRSNLDYIDEQENLNIVIQSLEPYIDLCKIINILPYESELINYEYTLNSGNNLNVYSDKENKPHYFNLFSYIIDSLVDTDYIMYCPFGIKINNLDIPQAIATLDLCEYLSAISFNQTVQHPKEVPPLKGKKLLKQFNLWKLKPLDFFELKILRVEMQNKLDNLSTLKFLSHFLGNAKYLNYPINRG
ncbi:glycosyltransferase family 4 protein [Nostoc sp. HG1]|nr:glycosyltransferase family 4 protein [Nostoc sp. HG1]